MKKKVRFKEIKEGEYFKHYRHVYIKIDFFNAVDIQIGSEKHFRCGNKVIPVTVTIKVKENNNECR